VATGTCSSRTRRSWHCSTDRLRALISDNTLRIRSFADAGQEDLRYQQTRRPTGIIFGFGVLIGVLVGLVIVFQVLSADVADHLREYATFKAMGYGPRFFLGIVVEEALVLGLLGFLPGLAVGTAILTLMGKATTLPLAMMNFVGENASNYALAAASLVVGMSPLLIAYLFLAERFVEGITAGAIKG